MCKILANARIKIVEKDLKRLSRKQIDNKWLHNAITQCLFIKKRAPDFQHRFIAVKLLLL